MCCVPHSVHFNVSTTKIITPILLLAYATSEKEKNAQ